MKKIISSFLIAILIALTPVRALAEDCDFSKGIEKLPDGRYAYSVACHLRVGKMVQDLADLNDQVTELRKTIELKDLAIKMSDDRANLWMNTALTLETRVTSMEQYKHTSELLYYGLGVATMALSVWGAGRLK